MPALSRRSVIVFAVCWRISLAVLSIGQSPSYSLVRKGEVVQICGIGILLRIPIHLVIDSHAIPITRVIVRIGLVQRVSDPVEGDRFVEKLIARGSLDLQRQMVPTIADR